MSKKKEFWDLIKKTWFAYLNDKAFLNSAALSYYLIVSIIPFFVFLLWILGKFFSENFVFFIIRNFLNQISTGGLSENFDFVIQALSDVSVGAGILGLIGIIFASSALYINLKKVLDIFWNSPVKRTPLSSKVMNFFAQRFLAFVVMLVLILFMFLLLLASILFPYLLRGMAISGWATYVLNYLLLFVLTSLFFWFIFWFIPGRKLPSNYLIRGSLFTSLLFLVGRVLIGIYFANSGRDFSGVAGSVFFVIIWAYYSFAVFLFGAEFTYVNYKENEEYKIIQH